MKCGEFDRLEDLKFCGKPVCKNQARDEYYSNQFLKKLEEDRKMQSSAKAVVNDDTKQTKASPI
jgi:hypothetical protein